MPAPPIYYIAKDDEINLFVKNGNNTDFAVILKRKGGNSLFDFYQFLKLENDSKEIETDISKYSVLSTTGTDWHAPFKVKADSNANGDNISDGDFLDYFTGGNHQYNNTASGSTSTARSMYLWMYADGRMLTEGEEGFASIIEIRWANQVQGQNTTKADGTGRYILQENHRLLYDGMTFKSFVELLPLEDIHITMWYGLQAVYSNVYSSLRFIDSDNRQKNSLPSSANCGCITNCRGMVLEGDELSLEMAIDPTLDLGVRKYNKGVYAAFAETYGKVYFGVISTTQCAMAKGDAYCLEGYYSFRLN